MAANGDCGKLDGLWFTTLNIVHQDFIFSTSWFVNEGDNGCHDHIDGVDHTGNPCQEE